MSITAERLRALKRQAGGGMAGSGKAALAVVAIRDPARADAGTGQVSARGAQSLGNARTAGSQAPVLTRHAGMGDRSGAADPPALLAGSGLNGDAGNARTSIESLRRLLGVRGRAVMPAVAPGPLDRSVPGDEIAPGLRLIQTHLPYPAPAAALSLAFAKREDAAVNPRDLLFFDTETTGLAGGTGTRAFMIGAADWHHDPVHGDGLRIRQLLITTLAAEPAMLRAFTGWLAPRTVLSSYNGRCYDSPLLKTRYRLARMRCPITPLDHVDLLFPTRRRYRGVWENCRLATIERELLEIVREDDLPGSEAPAAWLSYLRGGASTNLRRVAAHNHQDVVTLARLMTRLVAAQAADDAALALA